MAKPYDVTTKQLVDLNPAEWLRYVGLPVGAVTPFDTDLATVTTEADRVLRVDALVPYIGHLEFQTTYKADRIVRFLRYWVLLLYRYQMPVQTVVILLRPAADGPDVTGVLRFDSPDPHRSEPNLIFRYDVVRVWQQPVESLLQGPLATLPLAPLGRISSEDELRGVIRAMEDRIAREATQAQADILWVSTYNLLGLNYAADFVSDLLQGVRGMEDSSTYQATIAKGRIDGLMAGRVEEAQNLLMRVATKRLGPPPARGTAFILSLHDVAGLEALVDRVLEVESWDELLP